MVLESNRGRTAGANTDVKPFGSFYSGILRQNALHGMKTEQFTAIYDASSKLEISPEQFEVACSLASRINLSNKLRQLESTTSEVILAASLFLASKMEYERTKNEDVLRTIGEVSIPLKATVESVKGLVKWVTKIDSAIASVAKHVDGIHYAKRNVFTVVSRLGRDSAMCETMREHNITTEAKNILDCAKRNGFVFDGHSLETASKAVVIALERAGIAFDHNMLYGLLKGADPSGFEERLGKFRVFI